MTPCEYYSGFPRRWAPTLESFDRKTRRGAAKLDVLLGISKIKHNLISQGKPSVIPIDADDDAIFQAGDAAANEVYQYCERYRVAELIIDGIRLLCHRLNVSPPVADTNQGMIARATDRAWWVKKLKTEHKRRFEHTAIQLGITSLRNDPYLCRESALRQARYNKHNQKLLENTTVTNGTDDYTLAELAALSTSNKAIRRGELMLRIRGCEEVAQDLKHIALFWTITCPSKFHSVGGNNEKYEGATPRDAQAYLCVVWQRIRAALKRLGIQPYGFRIAEPHTDGCPHWHMLLFVEAEKEPAMSAVIRAYALAEDGDEAGAQDNRVKLVRIEAGQGTAAGYIAKYVSKNIDGHGVGDHKVFEDGRTYQIATDLFGTEEITASQRVTYWSQVWGIRQFQAIGGAPVGVWREMRRVKAQEIENAPEVIVKAWEACQRVISDDPNQAKQANYADYIRIQGGPQVGRNTAIILAKQDKTIEGRYETYVDAKPFGVQQAHCLCVYQSTRYEWTIKSRGVGVVVAVPRTGVNNCTQVDYPALQEKMTASTKTVVHYSKERKIKIPMWIDWPKIRKEAIDIEKNSKKFASQSGYRGAAKFSGASSAGRNDDEVPA